MASLCLYSQSKWSNFPSICSSALMRVECLVKPFHCFTYQTRRQTILIIQPIHIYPNTPTASYCMCVKANPSTMRIHYHISIHLFTLSLLSKTAYNPCKVYKGHCEIYLFSFLHFFFFIFIKWHHNLPNQTLTI